jgi:hypothetical protein
MSLNVKIYAIYMYLAYKNTIPYIIKMSMWRAAYTPGDGQTSPANSSQSVQYLLASCRIISSRFVWRGLYSVITSWACGCLACQQGKSHRHTRLVPQPIPIPQRRFSHLHVDLVGPLQYSNNANYIFTIIDRTSKWMAANALSETSAAACTKA